MTLSKSLLALLLFSLALIDAHTWVQCTDYRADKTCGGFIRNYQGRNPPGTDSTDDFYTNKLLGQDPEFTVCKADTQASAMYSAQFPKGTVRAGTTLKTMYTPNGHSDPGDVGETTFARIHWNRGPNGPSGQIRFRRDLNTSNELSRTNYAANCAKGGDVASLPCVNPYTIPRDTPPGTYQFVWYWPYNKNANQKPFGEEYYSCFELDVVAADANIPSSAPTSAPRTSASSSAPRTSAASSAPRTTAASSAPQTSASSSAPRTSASSSAPRTSATSAARSSSRIASSASEETSEDSTSEQTTQQTSAINSEISTDSSSLEDVASHSTKLIAVGLLSIILLI